ncbi:hypothetical protein GCM10023231_00240 [Olivibacter ginsenosidimutans]|uniref:Sigma-70 family RNA polymerase sigma factor n=1 Tax=Olivibacter ginsenosidimutans TaxID=1176537 RepID=A0ABP9ADB6_9SPHI
MHEDAAEKKEIANLLLGKVGSFNDVYQKYSRAVYQNIMKIVKSSDHAEDILQDVFVTLWQKRETLDPKKSIGGWLFMVSYHKSITFLRHKIKEKLSHVESLEAFEQIALEETVDEEHFEKQLAIIEEAVNRLSPRKRAVYRMCRFEGKTKEEVAERMGITPESVKDYLKQSNKAIRLYITSTYPYGTAGIVLLLCYLS